MYEMYPDAWTDEQAARQRPTGEDQPRRRARKPHSVVPAVILAHEEQSKADDRS
ncbi:hypothetical protein [Microlunatus ginsengisoli]